MNATKKKYLLAGFLWVTLCLPAVLSIWNPFEFDPLKGSYRKARYHELTEEHWFNGRYQRKFDQYVRETFVFREPIVRLYSQALYSAFNHSNTRKVIIGKEDYLFEIGYLNAYLGRNFVGEDSISTILSQLQDLQDTLAYYDTHFLFVLASGKGSFYPEYFPDSVSSKAAETTNYLSYSSQLEASRLHHIDFMDYMLALKDSSKHVLYPKTGIHWSYYAEWLVMDSLSKYIEENYAIALPEISFSEEYISTDMEYRDEDIEKAMNLIWDIEDLPMTYGKVKFTGKSQANSKLSVISDSFYWGLYSRGFGKKMFDENHFWYYSKHIYSNTYRGKLDVEDIDLKKQLEESDVFMFMATESTLNKFPYGFLDLVYPLYFPKDTISE